MSGLQTLFIKETNRVVALRNELKKVNVDLQIDKEKDLYKQSGKLNFNLPEFETYNDHRMAMAFAPLAIIDSIRINDHMVVSKSYPKFWQDLSQLGFNYSTL